MQGSSTPGLPAVTHQHCLPEDWACCTWDVLHTEFDGFALWWALPQFSSWWPRGAISLLFGCRLSKSANFTSVCFLCCLLTNRLAEDALPSAFFQLQTLEDTLHDIFHNHNNYFPWHLINTSWHRPKYSYSYSWCFCVRFSETSQVIHIVPTMPLEATKAPHQLL